MLAREGLDWGLIGPREVPRLWDRHLLNCAAIAPLVPEGARLADVGSGAGLPGIVLAALRPDLAVTLIEPLQRRIAFLRHAVDTLGLTGVELLRGRAEGEEARRAGPFDVVVARAVAPLDRLAGWCLPLVAPAGLFIAMKGDRAEAELRQSRPALRRLGGTDAAVHSISATPAQTPTVVVTMRRAGTSERPGRREGRTR